MSVAATAGTVPTVSPIKGVYAHLDCMMAGAKSLKAAGYQDRMHVITPHPRHEVDELMYEGKPSPVRWFTLIGAVFGACVGFSLASITHANWPMILPGGKPVVSVPPFIVITFEGMVLWGSLWTLTGLLLTARLPARHLPKAVEDPRFSNDHFGIVVERINATEASTIRSILSSSGAVEVDGGTDEKEAHGHA